MKITSLLNTIVEILSAGSGSVLEKSVLRIMQSSSRAPVLFYRVVPSPCQIHQCEGYALQFSIGGWLWSLGFRDRFTMIRVVELMGICRLPLALGRCPTD